MVGNNLGTNVIFVSGYKTRTNEGYRIYQEDGEQEQYGYTCHYLFPREGREEGYKGRKRTDHQP